MIDNQCANIFSTHATFYGSHSVKFAFIERENIFFHVYPQLSNLVFKFGFCFFPYLLKFSPKLILFFLFLLGVGGSFFNICGSQELLLFIGGVVSILYRVGFICFLDSLFSLAFCCICFLSTLCLSCLCQCVTKRGRFR